MQYRKKPIVIDAFKWTGGEDQEEDPIWIVEAIKSGMVEINKGVPSHAIMIIYPENSSSTLEAQIGDYIIKGIKGEIYPCKPDIFEETYEDCSDGKESPTMEALIACRKYILDKVATGELPNDEMPECLKLAEKEVMKNR